MNSGQWSRRDYAKLLLAVPAAKLLAASGDAVAVGNEAIELHFTRRAGKLERKEFVNKISQERFALPATEFTLDMGGVSVSSGDCTLKEVASGGEKLVFAYEGPERLAIEVSYEAAAKKSYLRKRIALRSPGGKPLPLLRAELETWKGIKRDWKSSTADKLSYGSHPIHCDTIWAGVEFPAAFNHYDADGFTLASRPGGREIKDELWQLRPVVLGVCEPGKARSSFFEYIEDVRHAPPRMTACYNSWWTLPLDITRQDALRLMNRLKSDLHGRTGTFFDIVTTDAGWSNRQSIWEIDPHNMPNGFDDLKAIIEPLDANMGLWMSPSEIYGNNCDWDWARKAGYAVVDPFPQQGNHGISLADPKYRERAVAQLKNLIKEQDFHQIKYDGFIALEEKAHDSLLPGDDSVEPLVENVLELMAESYQARPDLLTEPTFLNSWANFITPWMICHGDSVWANAGGDCPLGLGPAPAYREASTTAREFFVFSSMNEVWLPQNAVQYFDIVHCDDAEGFANHVAMAVGRGRFFLSTYINPKFMRPEDWDVYAGFVKWAKENQTLLRHTEPIPSRVELGEAYAYGHWEGSRGVIAVRNPSNVSVTYRLELARSGAPRDLKNAVCHSIYPYRAGLRAGVTGTDTVNVVLAPWELMYLEVIPAQALKETVAIGGRWFESSGGMRVAALAGAKETMLLEAGGGKKKLTLSKRGIQQASGTVTDFQSKLLPGPEWMSEKDKMYPSAAFEMTCQVEAPERSTTKILVLVEFPGIEHRPSGCKILLEGREAKLERSDSSGHIGYHQAKAGSYWNAIMPYQSHWTWYSTDVPPGSQTMRITGDAGHPNPRIGVWAWTDTDLNRDSMPAEFAGKTQQLPQIRAHVERHGICLRQPA